MNKTLFDLTKKELRSVNRNLEPLELKLYNDPRNSKEDREALIKLFKTGAFSKHVQTVTGKEDGVGGFLSWCIYSIEKAEGAPNGYKVFILPFGQKGEIV